MPVKTIGFLHKSSSELEGVKYNKPFFPKRLFLLEPSVIWKVFLLLESKKLPGVNITIIYISSYEITLSTTLTRRRRTHRDRIALNLIFQTTTEKFHLSIFFLLKYIFLGLYFSSKRLKCAFFVYFYTIYKSSQTHVNIIYEGLLFISVEPNAKHQT